MSDEEAKNNLCKRVIFYLISLLFYISIIPQRRRFCKQIFMNKYIIHNVSHTHWDREWYLPYETMRLRLIDMMDTLLGIMDSDFDYRYFTLDGQTVVMEDYREICTNLAGGHLIPYILETEKRGHANSP